MKFQKLKPIVMSCLTMVFIVAFTQTGYAYYTTRGQDFINRKSGEKVDLHGIGLGCWLLPEGYMWGIRKIDRPRQFEAAIEDLIGKEDAKNSGKSTTRIF